MNVFAFTMLLALVVFGCAAPSAPKPGVLAPAATVADNTTLPNFVIRLSSALGPTRNNLTVVQGLRITFVALNTTFKIENRELGVNASIAPGENTVVRIAPTNPGTYTLRCTTGCPPGKDTITVKTLQGVPAPQQRRILDDNY